ncbi:S1C family serine protease [Chloroflexota bacterium]
MEIYTPQSPPPPVPASPPAEITPMNPVWTPPPVELQPVVLPDFVSVIAKVKPSVVAIGTKVASFNIFTGTFIEEGAGSGWIISEEGYIVTNNHVVEGAESIEVTLDDGSTYPAETVRTDPLTDLAVLKIDVQGLHAAAIGDSSKMEVGNWVIAIGNSLGLGISATKGIVSALGASLPMSPGQALYDLIQTDAAINPGNSGGPLVNMAGEVIGINSVKVARVGVEGMGYSISSNIAIPVIQELITTGYVIRPWLGLGLYTVDKSIARRYNLPVDEGVVVTQVADGSPADKAGLEAGDVIIKFGGEEVKEVNELIQTIHSQQVGQAVEITFWRDDNENTTTVVLSESPPPR